MTRYLYPLPSEIADHIAANVDLDADVRCSVLRGAVMFDGTTPLLGIGSVLEIAVGLSRPPSDSTTSQIDATYRRIMDRDHQTDMVRAASKWWTEEDRRSFNIGCPNWSDRPALIFLVEAGRSLCGMERAQAARLLRLALAEIESTG